MKFAELSQELNEHNGSGKRDPLSTSYSTTYSGVIAFITTAQERSFSAAAEKLGVGRSAVSRSIQRLEEQLNTRLFIRNTRTTALTNEGLAFYNACQPGVEQIARSVEEMRDLRSSEPGGTLRISAPSGFGRNVVAPLLKEFQRRYPCITLELMLDDRAPDFASNRIDVAFHHGILDDSTLMATKLVPMQMYFCVSPDYANRFGIPQTIDSLTEHRTVGYRFASGQLADWRIRLNGTSETIRPSSPLSFNDCELVLQSVLRGGGVGQLPGYHASFYLQTGELLSCLAQYAPDDRFLYIYHIGRRQLPRRIRAFIDHMTREIRAMSLHGLNFSSSQPSLKSV